MRGNSHRLWCCLAALALAACQQQDADTQPDTAQPQSAAVAAQAGAGKAGIEKDGTEKDAAPPAAALAAGGEMRADAGAGRPPSGVADTPRTAAPLDLSLPRDDSTGFVPPDSPGTAALLPDLFQQGKRDTRTSFSGELMLNEGEEAAVPIRDRVNGARIEMEVKLK